MSDFPEIPPGMGWPFVDEVTGEFQSEAVKNWIDERYVARDVSGLIYQNGNLVVDVSNVATEAAAGIAEIATQAEADLGTGDARIITPLKLKNVAHLPFAMAAGRAAYSSTIATGAGATLNVTLPVGRFSVAPLVNATVRNSARIIASVLAGETAAGFSIRIDNFSGGNGTPDGVNWHAVQMTSGAASG